MQNYIVSHFMGVSFLFFRFYSYQCEMFLDTLPDQFLKSQIEAFSPHWICQLDPRASNEESTLWSFLKLQKNGTKYKNINHTIKITLETIRIGIKNQDGIMLREITHKKQSPLYRSVRPEGI